MKIIINFLIRFYQLTISPDHGTLRAFFPYGYCRYYPTCSEYAGRAIKKYGFYGVWLAARRLSRCHPWHAGGIDHLA